MHIFRRSVNLCLGRLDRIRYNVLFGIIFCMPNNQAFYVPRLLASHLAYLFAFCTGSSVASLNGINSTIVAVCMAEEFILRLVCYLAYVLYLFFGILCYFPSGIWSPAMPSPHRDSAQTDREPAVEVQHGPANTSMIATRRLRSSTAQNRSWVCGGVPG